MIRTAIIKKQRKINTPTKTKLFLKLKKNDKLFIFSASKNNDSTIIIVKNI